jgi:hypothetical protein
LAPCSNTEVSEGDGPSGERCGEKRCLMIICCLIILTKLT